MKAGFPLRGNGGVSNVPVPTTETRRRDGQIKIERFRTHPASVFLGLTPCSTRSEGIVKHRHSSPHSNLSGINPSPNRFEHGVDPRAVNADCRVASAELEEERTLDVP